MNILSLLGSKASMAIIGVVLVGATWGGMKFKIWRLEGQLAKEQATSAQIQVRERVCKSDLGELRMSFTKQNERIDLLQEDAAAMALAADQAVLQVLVTPEEIEKIVQGPPGHDEMNRFVIDLIKEGS